MIGAFSTFQIEQWINGLVASDIWLGLMDDDPFGVTDPLTVEISSGGYTRPGPVTWSRPGPKQARVHSMSSWGGLTPGTTVRAVAGFDAATNGNMRFAVFTPTPTVITSSGMFLVAADSLYVGVDV